MQSIRRARSGSLVLENGLDQLDARAKFLNEKLTNTNTQLLRLRCDHKKLEKKYQQATCSLKRMESNVEGGATTHLEKEHGAYVQQIITTIKGLCNKAEFSDVNVATPDSKQTIPAHRLVLMSRCPTLLLQQEGCSTVNAMAASAPCVTLLNSSRTTALQLLKFIYTDEITFESVQDCLDVLHLATDFPVPTLKSTCELYLLPLVDPNNVISILKVAWVAATQQLSNCCMRIIDENFDELARQSHSFQDLPIDLVGALVRMHSYTPLHTAITLCRNDIVSAILSSAGVDIDQLDEHGRSALEIALKTGLYDVAHILVAKGADVDIGVFDDSTSICAAMGNGRISSNGNLGQVPKCTEDKIGAHKASHPNGNVGLAQPILHHMIETRDMRASRFLLEHGADVKSINADGYNPLHLACMFGPSELVTLLLRFGAVACAQTPLGQTPLHLAIINNQKDNVTALLKGTLSESGQGDVGKRAKDIEREKRALQQALNIQDLKQNCALSLALLTEQTDIATALLEHGADINLATPSGDTLLHGAIHRQDDATLLFLLAHGADVSRTNKDKQSPLHLAVVEGSESLARLLLAHGADINARDMRGMTPIHLAVWLGYFSMVQLLAHATPRPDLTIPNSESWTPLRTSLRKRYDHISKFLVSNGSDVNATGPAGETLLECYIRERDSASAIFLIKNGADIMRASPLTGKRPLQLAIESGMHDVVEEIIQSCREEQTLIDGATPLELALRNQMYSVADALIALQGDTLLEDVLHIFCAEGVVSAVAYLINKRANVNAKRGEQGRTALHVASSMGHATVVKLLVDNGAWVDAQDSEGRAALHYAVQFSQPEVLQLLLSYRARVGLRDVRGNTPIVAVVHSGSNELAQVFINNGLRLDDIHPNGSCMLFDMLDNGHSDAAKFLVEMDCNVHHKDAVGQTALHKAVRLGMSDVVDTLLERSADPNASDADGCTPLHLAATDGKANIVDLLVSKSNVNAMTRDGDTALHLAARAGHVDVLQALLGAADVNVPNKAGQTALHIVAGNPALLPSLISEFIVHNVQVNAVDKDGNTPLHMAAHALNRDAAVLLVRNGASLCLPNKKKMSPLDILVANKTQGSKPVEMQWALMDNILREPSPLPDNMSANCQICKGSFSITNRRHHCRHCGRLVCHSCSNKDMFIRKFGGEKPLRVCIPCHAVLAKK